MATNPTGIGAAGLAIVKEFEGFPNGGRPYWDRPASDPRRVLTIGYGTTRINGRPVRSTDHLTKTEASALLVRQINGNYGAALTVALNRIGITTNQNEYDALLSIVYNCGPGILDRGRSLGDALRAGNWRSRVPGALLEYSEPGNKNVHAGLLRRRRAEVVLFRSEKGLKPVERKIKLGEQEQYHVDRLRAKRRVALRASSNGKTLAWSKVSKQHVDDAVESKAWLRARANHLADSNEVKDRDYAERKVKLLRDVALDRNGKGR